ncbi:MAG TPA: hypothetical protein PKD29_01790 [Rhodocyclaceae bacterium]|nr:hypothetical protein [Rhodocyclaceae bacterium]
MLKKLLLIVAALAATAFPALAADLVYDSFLDDVFGGQIVKTDPFKCLLTTSGYTEDRGAHTRRSDVTSEVSGAGYTAGGVAVVPTVVKDTVNHRVRWTWPTTTFSAVTLTARKMVCYKSRGGAASADELVWVNDFGSDVTATGVDFVVQPSTIDFSTPQ